MVIENALYHIGALLSEDSVLPMEINNRTSGIRQFACHSAFHWQRYSKATLKFLSPVETFLINALYI